MIEKTNLNLLAELDSLEQKIKEANEITKQYEDVKKQIKKAMSEAGRNNNLEQIKWTTPAGTKITCTIGHPAIIEDQTTKEFDIEKLKAFHPDIYESCMTEKTRGVIIKNATSDTLRITLAKGE